MACASREGRATFLTEHHPKLAAEYGEYLRSLRAEVLRPLAHLEGELDALSNLREPARPS
jgi:hypothetical protein